LTWVLYVLQYVHLYIRVNGDLVGYFTCDRKVRHEILSLLFFFVLLRRFWVEAF